MKTVKIIEEVEEEGLLALIGELVVLYCANYIYTGTLVGVNDDCIKLKDAAIVYETGPHTAKKWKDAQPLASEFTYIMKGAIESFAVTSVSV